MHAPEREKKEKKKEKRKTSLSKSEPFTHHPDEPAAASDHGSLIQMSNRI